VDIINTFGVNTINIASGPPPSTFAPEVLRGQAIYTKRTLAAYDLVVLGLMNHVVWRCPTGTLSAHYAARLGAAHLELGVGSGHFLDHAAFPVPRPRVTLVDLNQDALAYAARRLARYDPRVVTADVLAPLPIPTASADSVGLGYLLHCLPGDLTVKRRVLTEAARVVRDDGCVFGATILSSGVRHTPLSRAQLRWLNTLGVLSNQHDDLRGLRDALDHEFHEFELTVTGAVALFSARRPRRNGEGAQAEVAS
jgi:ubiquinone/menaquinone biosynthesis C-methylase UbiE